MVHCVYNCGRVPVVGFLDKRKLTDSTVIGALSRYNTKQNFVHKCQVCS